MKKFIFAVAAVGFVFSFTSHGAAQVSVAVKKPKYDAKLAKKLGSDDLGMKQYVMVFLKRGPAKLEKSERSTLIKKHLENIGKLAEAKKLVLAGPFLDDTDLAGIYVFDVKTVEEAKALTETDPAVAAGVFVMELHPWYGSAALMALDPIHKKIAKKKPGE
jgi:uncharacterized protein YciI